MVIQRNGPFDDMALDDMVLDEVSCSPFLHTHFTEAMNLVEKKPMAKNSFIKKTYLPTTYVTENKENYFLTSIMSFLYACFKHPKLLISVLKNLLLFCKLFIFE